MEVWISSLGAAGLVPARTAQEGEHIRADQYCLSDTGNRVVDSVLR